MNVKPSLDDTPTAQAFSTSWNNLPAGSVYTREQVVAWLAPLSPEESKGKNILEMGCGNVLYHVALLHPACATGIDLGDSILSSKANMSLLNE